MHATHRTLPRRLSRLGLGLGALALSLSACVEAVEVPDPVEPVALAPGGDAVTVELQYMRFNAKQYELALSLDDLKAMPEETLRRTWLLDLDARPLITNALNILINTSPEEADLLPPAERNMWKLLNLTAHSTKLEGTSLERLIDVGEVVDLAGSTILADLVGVDAKTRLISVELLTDAVIDNVMTTHPNAQWRKGPITPEHPDGLYEVKYGHIPVSLYDVINGFQDLAEVFGPTPLWEDSSIIHPGFVSQTSGLVATTPAFAMTVKANLNALPYEGVDLTNGGSARVNSTPAQIEDAFDFSTDDWMVVEGLVDQLVIAELTMQIHENPDFWPGGTSKDPAPQGDSPVWTEVPEWEFEHLIMSVAEARAAEIEPHCTTYTPPQSIETPVEAVQACVEEDKWVNIDLFLDLQEPEGGDIEPPPPSYFWDILVEVAQVLLHQNGVAEGDGSVELALTNVPTGVTTEELIETMKANVMINASALTEFAKLLNDNGSGDPDFYYYQPNAPQDGVYIQDWLYFVSNVDIRKDENGQPVREYSNYKNPGFFANPALTQKLSATTPLDGDSTHEKVQIQPGDVLYIEDDEGQVFKLSVGEKPSAHRVSIDIERIE